MVVDVLPVRVGGNNKRILALQKTLGKLVTDAVGFFWRNFTRLERLPHLIGDNIAFLPASVYEIVLPLGKHKFFICCQGATSIAADILPLLGLVRVFNIVRAIFQAGRNGHALVFVQRNQPCCCQHHHPLLQRKNAARRRH